MEQPDITIPAISDVECASYCVYDKTAGQIILSSNETDTIYPASMTKIMTAQLGLDYLDTDAMLTVSQDAIDNVTSDSTLMGLYVGEEVEVSELLYGMMLPSGNDAANVVAEGTISALFRQYPADGEEVGPDGINASYFENQLQMSSDTILDGYKLQAFALLMNYRAQEIGCTNTHFVNANGLHDDNHYTTASDLTLIMAKACENEDFCRVINTTNHVFQATNLHTEDGWSMVKNTNNLLFAPYMAATTAEGYPTHMKIFVGGKTGTTSMAGTGMTVYTINENGHELFTSVCGIATYAYQTRYVAAVTAQGNLVCWQNDPETVIQGNIEDYMNGYATNSERSVYDPLTLGSNEEIDPALYAEAIGETIETEPPETEATAETTSPDVTESTVLSTMDKVNLFVSANTAVAIIIGAIIVLILVLIIVLIIREIVLKGNHKKRKMRPYTGKREFDNIDKRK